MAYIVEIVGEPPYELGLAMFRDRAAAQRWIAEQAALPQYRNALFHIKEVKPDAKS